MRIPTAALAQLKDVALCAAVSKTWAIRLGVSRPPFPTKLVPNVTISATDAALGGLYPDSISQIRQPTGNTNKKS